MVNTIAIAIAIALEMGVRIEVGKMLIMGRNVYFQQF